MYITSILSMKRSPKAMHRSMPVVTVALVILSVAAVLAAPAVSPVHAQGGWQSEERLTDDGATSLPSPNNGKYLAVDREGKLHVVWADDRDRTFEIHHKVRVGGIWSDDEKITTTLAYSSRPVLAVDTLGRVHLVFNDDREGNSELYHMIWGGAWGPQRRITETEGRSFGACIVAKGLQIHLVYMERISGHLEIMYRRSDLGLWDDAVPLTDVGSGERMVPTIAIDTAGTLHVAWWDTREDPPGNSNGKIYYRERTDTWLDEVRLTAVSVNAMRPTITADDSGSIHVAWIDGRDTYDQIYYRRRGLSGWENETALTFGDATHYHPSIASAGGDIFIAYWDNHLSESNSEVFFRRQTHGLWGGVFQVSNGAGPSTLCCLIAEPNKNIHIAWADERDGNQEIYYRTYIDPANGVGDDEIDEIDEIPDEITAALHLHPNPFRGSTRIELSLAGESDVELSVYNVEGKRVRTLARDSLPHGLHYYQWDGRNDSGAHVAAGVYITLARVGKKRLSAKVLYLGK